MKTFLGKRSRRSQGKESSGNKHKEHNDELMNALDRLPESPELLLRELEQTPDCPDDDTFCRYVTGKLPKHESKRIREHVSNCYACMAALDDLTEDDREAETSRTPQKVIYEKGPSKGWGWGLGFGVPISVACMVLLLVLSGPPLEMHMSVVRNAMRSGEATSPVALVSGGAIHEGDAFTVEVSATKNGYVYLYVWSEAEAGEFIFPKDAFQDNHITKGQTVSLPDNEGWIVEDVPPGQETLYLLFSETRVSPEKIAQIQKELRHAGKDEQKLQKIMNNSFSVQQKIIYTVD